MAARKDSRIRLSRSITASIFHIVRHTLIPDELYRTLMEQKQMTFEELEFAARSSYNVIAEIHLELEVRK